MRLFVRTSLLTLLLLATASPMEIKWSGEKPEGRALMERRLGALSAAGVSGQNLSDSAASWLHRDGYLDASASTNGQSMTVDAGPRFYLRNLVPSDSMTSAVSVDRPFTPTNIETAMDRLLAQYRDEGFYYAHAGVKEAQRDGVRIDLVADVNRGPLVTVMDINFRGLSRTRPEIVSRYLDFNPGDTLSAKLLARLERQASAIPFLRFEPPATVEPRPGYTEALVGLTFAEKRQFNLAGGAGYIPEDETGLVWNFDLALRNLLGGGRDMQIQSERPEKKRNRLLISYAQPVFLLGPDRVSFEVATRDYRREFYEFRLHGQYATHYYHNFTTSIGMGWKRVEPADLEPSYSAYTVDFTIGRSMLDNQVNPTGGYCLEAGIGYAYRRYSAADSARGGAGESFNETTARLNLDRYQPLVGRLLGHLSLNYLGLETAQTEPPLSEIFLIGGPGTLRGYRNEQFPAQRALFGTVEPRLRFKNSFLFAFYDGAYLNRRIATPTRGSETTELYRSGYGLGLAIVDRDRSVKLSLGWNQEDGFSQPRLSVEFSSDL